MKSALLFGATGFVGSNLLTLLLASPAYSKVTIVVRKNPGVSNDKLEVLTGDFNSLPGLAPRLVADDVFIALGTTKKNTPDEKLYYQVDHDYPVLGAKLAKQNGATSVFIVTAIGADISSRTFYIRLKGEVERDMIALDYPHTHIFRPSMILGQRKEERALEKVLIKIFRVINPVFVGGMSRFRGIEGIDIARAMLKAAGEPAGDVTFYQWKEMNGLLHR